MEFTVTINLWVVIGIILLIIICLYLYAFLHIVDWKHKKWTFFKECIIGYIISGTLWFINDGVCESVEKYGFFNPKFYLTWQTMTLMLYVFAIFPIVCCRNDKH